MLAPHQQRVVQERTDLITKITALEVFLTASPRPIAVPDDEVGRLTAQLSIMWAYKDILELRIVAF